MDMRGIPVIKATHADILTDENHDESERVGRISLLMAVAVLEPKMAYLDCYLDSYEFLYCADTIPTPYEFADLIWE